MAERKARIDLTNLPPRPRQLKPEELPNVFGGCNGRGIFCSSNSDCCSQKCWSYVWTGYLWVANCN